MLIVDFFKKPLKFGIRIRVAVSKANCVRFRSTIEGKVETERVVVLTSVWVFMKSTNLFRFLVYNFVAGFEPLVVL